MNVLARIRRASTPAPPAPPAGPLLRLSGVRKGFKGAAALDGVDLAVGRGEFFTLLGPSGSGKTTTLRLVAGFERPDSGTVELDGRDLAATPPFDRDINTVFQDYALFPHMTVADNVAYGLRARGVKGAECAARVADALRVVRMEGFGARLPAQLSGGQRQRVGVARAVVNRPGLLLLDEPLGALDLQLRREMQVELKQIQAEVGITFLYVTHDQEEALSMSTRVAVFNRGRIEQVGTPRDVYDRPATAFVAGFVGTSALLERGGRTLVLRPEKAQVLFDGAAPPPGLQVEEGALEDVAFLGAFTRFAVRLGDGTRVEALRPNAERLPQGLRPGAPLRVGWRPDDLWALD